MWLSLLRGINVGRHKKIKMAELRELYQSMGLTNVQSYIQSGNVVFCAPEQNAQELSSLIQTAIYKKYGFEVSVLMRQETDLLALAEHKPSHFDVAKAIYICFSSQDFSTIDLDCLKPYCKNGECYEPQGKQLYLYYPNGYGKSKLNNNLIESKIKCIATTRNWNSLLRLKSLMASNVL